MNEIVIVYGKLSLKIFIIKIDESKVYYENKIINITKEQISNLLNILVSFDDKSYDKNILDSNEYEIDVLIDGNKSKYVGNNVDNLNKIIDWLGEINAR